MSRVILQDETARQAIISDLDTCLLVEAGAGSGKTTSLVQRMVALIKENRCQVDTLAAITFTRKAAAELKGRFQLALEEAFAEESDPVKRVRLDQALGKLGRCFVGTVHSFCSTLLRERPVEARIDPDFGELEELDDAVLRSRAWDDYLLQMQLTDPQALKVLSDIGCDPGELKDFYETLLNYPDVEIVQKAVPMPNFDEIRHELYSFLDWAQGLLPQQVPPKGWDALQKLIRKGIQHRDIFDLEEDLNLLELLSELDRKPGIVKNRWDDPDDAQDALDAFEKLKEEHILPFLRQWREHCYCVLVDFVQPALDYYRDLKDERSKLNFQDLLLQAASLLRDNPEVRCYFQGRFTHLLVDEFQDTDPVQAEVMFYLTGTDLAEKNWYRLIPRPGSLFVVGDPRQSIYRFRRADIDTYNEVKKLLEASGGRVLTLTTNFRSVKAIGGWVNSVFHDVFPQQAIPCQASFASMDTVRFDGKGCDSGIRLISIPKVARNNRREITQIDAEKIASFIYRALHGELKLARTPEENKMGLTENPQPGDFLLLLRYKAYMDVYARALEDLGIPFRIAGGSGFSASREIRDLLHLFQSLLDPEDPIKLLSALRGGLFAVSDDSLWEFKEAGGDFHINAQMPAALDTDTANLFDESFKRLQVYCEWVRTLPASAAAAKIMQDTGIIPTALAGEQGKAQAGYIVQGLEFLASAERMGVTSFAELVSFLETLIDAGIEEEIDLYPWDDQTVRIMNLHKAKGLEAPVVILANPTKGAGFAPSIHISRAGEKPCGYFLIQKRKFYRDEILGQPAGWEHFSQKEKEYLEAEENRLLYVAATRAKNLLVVSIYPDKPTDSPWHLFNKNLTTATVLDDQGSSGMISCEKNESSLKPADMEEARGNFLNHESSINLPSYLDTAVTSLVKSSGSFPSRVMTGRGFSWGRTIHHVLEYCAKKDQDNLDLFIKNVLIEEGRVPEEKEEVLEYVKGILSSPFWKRVMRSKKRFVEVPFGQHVPGSPGNNDTLVSGVIDLVFLEEEGWVIVDYKTDTVKDDEELYRLVDYYSPQLDLYRSFWEEIAGEKVLETGLYFTSVDRWVPLNFEESKQVFYKQTITGGDSSEGDLQKRDR
jgi:ATP-dependent helicase/nuclease subunit A